MFITIGNFHAHVPVLSYVTTSARVWSSGVVWKTTLDEEALGRWLTVNGAGAFTPAVIERCRQLVEKLT